LGKRNCDGRCPSLRTANRVTRLRRTARVKFSIQWPPSLRSCPTTTTQPFLKAIPFMRSLQFNHRQSFLGEPVEVLQAAPMHRSSFCAHKNGFFTSCGFGSTDLLGTVSIRAEDAIVEPVRPLVKIRVDHSQTNSPSAGTSNPRPKSFLAN
jgi:hypothetical protein